MQERHALHRGADEPAAELVDRLVQPRDVPGSSQMSSSRNSAYRAAEWASSAARCSATPGARVHHRPHRCPAARSTRTMVGAGGFERRRPVGLVADHHVERVLLRGQPGERDASSTGRSRVGIRTSSSGTDRAGAPSSTGPASPGPPPLAWRGSG